MERTNRFLVVLGLFLLFFSGQNKSSSELPKHTPRSEGTEKTPKQADIERAAFWRTRGYEFDPKQLSALDMDEKVKELNLVVYFKEVKGWEYNPKTGIVTIRMNGEQGQESDPSSHMGQYKKSQSNKTGLRLSREEGKKREKEKREKRAEFERLKSIVMPLLEYDLELLQAAVRVKVFEIYNRARVVAIDPNTHNGTLLGNIEDEYATFSIFNKLGTYGKPGSIVSIWNKNGRYGGSRSHQSPFNPDANYPPVIIKGEKIIGHLTIGNEFYKAIDPNWLKDYFAY